MIELGGPEATGPAETSRTWRYRANQALMSSIGEIRRELVLLAR